MRGGERLVARLVAGRADAAPPRPPAVRLASTSAACSTASSSQPLERRAPGSRRDRDRASHVTGLNFRDVLIALDLYPERGRHLRRGVQRRGRARRRRRRATCGPATGCWRWAPAPSPSYLTTPADLAVPVPGGHRPRGGRHDPDRRSSPPSTPSWPLGRLQAGERVLIHAGAGGVGMAAVQLAQRARRRGAATAGSPEKRALLQSLGVRPRVRLPLARLRRRRAAPPPAAPVSTWCSTRSPATSSSAASTSWPRAAASSRSGGATSGTADAGRRRPPRRRLPRRLPGRPLARRPARHPGDARAT